VSGKPTKWGGRRSDRERRTLPGATKWGVRKRVGKCLSPALSLSKSGQAHSRERQGILAVLASDEKRRYRHAQLILSDEQSTETGFLPARRFTSRNAGAALRELKASCRHDDQSRDSCPDEAERFHRESQSLVSWAQKNDWLWCLEEFQEEIDHHDYKYVDGGSEHNVFLFNDLGVVLKSRNHRALVNRDLFANTRTMFTGRMSCWATTFGLRASLTVKKEPPS
jgi:hypothetical protein